MKPSPTSWYRKLLALGVLLFYQPVSADNLVDPELDLENYTGTSVSCFVAFLEESPTAAHCTDDSELIFRSQQDELDVTFYIGKTVTGLAAFSGAGERLPDSQLDQEIWSVLRNLQRCSHSGCQRLNNSISEAVQDPSRIWASILATQNYPVRRKPSTRTVWITCIENETTFIWSEDSQWSFGQRDLAVSIVLQSICPKEA